MSQAPSTSRAQAEGARNRTHTMLRLLAEAAGDLLGLRQPERMVANLFEKVSAFLELGAPLAADLTERRPQGHRIAAHLKRGRFDIGLRARGDGEQGRAVAEQPRPDLVGLCRVLG